MYLEKKVYVGNNYKKGDEVKKFNVEGVNDKKVTYINEEVAYWRKANAIHNWFVKNVQDGVDECQNSYVSAEQLKELLDTCKAVLKGSELVEGKVSNGYTYNDKNERVYNYNDGKVIRDTSIAEELLPTGSGFFFGSTEYDEYYYNDIKYTVEMLEEILKGDLSDSFYYQASW